MLLPCILVALVLGACSLTFSATPERDRAFASLLSTTDVNETIYLVPIDQSRIRFEKGSLVSLSIRNRGSESIGFAADFGVQALYFDEVSNRWQTLPNEVKFPSTNTVLGTLNSGIPSVAVVDFSPDKDPPAGVDLIRILVKGDELDSNFVPARPVAAYYDLEIGP